MNVGITGHQYRPSIDWGWVAQAIRGEIKKLPTIKTLFSSLATGSDQIAADVAIDLGVLVTAVIPVENYEQYFNDADLTNYRRILAHCDVVQLAWRGDSQGAFFEAGKYIVGNSDMLLAVWDGKRAGGIGGTGDVVAYAKRRAKKIIHIDPLNRKMRILDYTRS
jgi:uncharacterized phage-like protein YoqJ